MDKNMKRGLAVVAIFAVVFGLTLVGNNRPAQADVSESGISINLGFSEIMTLLKTYLGVNDNDARVSGSTSDSWSVGGALTVTGATTLGTGLTLTTGNLALSAGNMSVVGSTVVDEFTQGGGCNASSTDGATGETLLEADLLAYNCFIYASGSESDGFTWTLPATSTMATLLASVGDQRSWIFYNATTTAATLTIAPGSGIEMYGESNAVDVIDHTEMAEVTCTRMYSTGAAIDVFCTINELVDATE